MTDRRSDYLRIDGAELHVTLWGRAEAPAVVLWHGLARTGRDFDELAAALAPDHFVICPDTLGRGLSGWASDPDRDYGFDCYARHALGILDHYGIDRLDWVGTSMGGALGIRLAAGPLADRIGALVINDIGPELPADAIGRIADYVGAPPVVDHVSDLEAWLRQSYAPFGTNSAAFWRRMADTSVRRCDNGQVTVHYDPAIVRQLHLHPQDYRLWPEFERVTARMLLLRGVSSDLLPVEMADRMEAVRPDMARVEMDGFGHAPTLARSADHRLVREFLTETQHHKI
ncbi:alpha/beta fold hydrolase [Oceanomicrobium pacificus]|uniref:Alpha/beta fold hydrolase n=1 Tax=Oceanomicrobium pacificus TaxID=2692916 RepID=A0A6B0TZ22_9RHOB|nr:alpha/beta fold hydrolase [Oceanomicrobium pacificus]MXU66658.1 alpha/beta fold hydrolase [Oceanomicrobium pacificus]